ncbi:MAG: hypothetical protein QM690_12275, partial [Sphingobium sp.]
ATGSIFAYDLTSAGSLGVGAGGAVTLRNLSATGLIDIDTPFALSIGTAEAGQNILLDAGGDIVTAEMDAGDSIIVRSGGSIIVNGAVTAGIVNPSASSAARYDVGLYGLGSIRTADIQAAGRAGLVSGTGLLDVGTIRAASDILLLGSGNVSASGIASTGGAGQYVYIGSSSILSGLPDTAFDPAPIFASAPVALDGDIAVSGGIGGGTLLFANSGTFTSGDISAQGGIGGTSGSMSTGAIAAGGPIALSGGNLAFGSMDGGADLVLNGTGSVSAAAVRTGGGLSVTAPGNVTLGALDAGGAITVNGASGVTAGNVLRAASVQFGSGGNVTAGTIGSSGAVNISGAFLSVGAVTAQRLAFTATGAASFGNVGSAADIVGSAAGLVMGDLSAIAPLQLSSTGALALGNVTGGENVTLSASGLLTTGAVNAVGAVTLAGAGITASGTVSGSQIGFTAGGAARFGFLSTGGAINGSGASIEAGNLSAGGALALNGSGDMTLGALNGGGDIALASSGGNIALTSATAGGSMLIQAGGNVDIALFANAGGALRAASTGNISIASATAASLIDLRADNGLLSISGTLDAPSISFSSSDIAIGTAARIDAGDAGLISIYSTNAQGMRIGGGTAGGGYLLDRAEFATLNSGSVIIGGVDGASAVDMTIGDLDITGPLAGSTIDDPNGTVTFFTGNPATQAHGGVIRITGSLRATGFLDTNGIVFSTGRFELDAATGLLEIVGEGSALGGTLYFDAPRIHVATASILDRLAQDSRYDGRAADLNTPLSTPRPDGVLRAANIELGEADAVLVQNTGTADLPAGFLTTGETRLDRETIPALGSVDLIINGQLRTASGLLTGRDVRDFLIDDLNRPYFTPDSSINGCALSGDCRPVANGIETPAQILQSDNLLATQTPPGFNEPQVPQGGDPEETTEQRRRRQLVEQEAKRSPIPPPTPLIDTQPLNPGNDLDEPVSGSGNPSLIGGGMVSASIGRGNQ